MTIFLYNSYQTACQPGLGACGAIVSSPSRLVLSDLIGAENRQLVNVRQNHIVPYFPRLARTFLALPDADKLLQLQTAVDCCCVTCSNREYIHCGPYNELQCKGVAAFNMYQPL